MNKAAPLREFLKGAGVSERDIGEAVREARKVTQAVEFWGNLAHGALSHLSTHPKIGKRVRPYIVFGSRLVQSATDGARTMLGKK